MERAEKLVLTLLFSNALRLPISSTALEKITSQFMANRTAHAGWLCCHTDTKSFSVCNTD